MRAEWRELVSQRGWSASLPDIVQNQLLAALRTELVQNGSEAIRQGEPFAGLVCVLEGEMQVVGTAHRGDELFIGILRPGDWTGFLAAIDHGEYAFSVRAVKNCRIARLDPSATQRIFEQDLYHFRLLLRPELIVSRKNYSYFVETAYRPPMQRLAERMMGLGRWPYSLVCGDIASLEQLTQSDLANATRLSRQTTNGCLQEMANHGLVRLGYKSVEVLDPVRLGMIANGTLELN